MVYIIIIILCSRINSFAQSICVHRHPALEGSSQPLLINYNSGRPNILNDFHEENWKLCTSKFISQTKNTVYTLFFIFIITMYLYSIARINMNHIVDESKENDIRALTRWRLVTEIMLMWLLLLLSANLHSFKL